MTVPRKALSDLLLSSLLLMFLLVDKVALSYLGILEDRLFLMRGRGHLGIFFIYLFISSVPTDASHSLHLMTHLLVWSINWRGPKWPDIFIASSLARSFFFLPHPRSTTLTFVRLNVRRLVGMLGKLSKTYGSAIGSQ